MSIPKKARRYFRRPGQQPGSAQQAGPPAVGAEEETSERLGPKPLGVPREYRVPSTITSRGTFTADASARAAEAGQGVGAIVNRGPRYFDGDQWKIAGSSGATVTQIQQAMVTAGLLTDFDLGTWDKRSADAYAEVLSFANAAGITDQMALQQMVESPNIKIGGSGSGGGGGRQIIGFDENGDPIYSEYAAPPLEIKTTNKTDLKMLLRSLTSEKLGVAWSDSELDELVDAYNWQEIRVQRDNYERTVAAERTAFNEGPGAVSGQVLAMEEAPSPEAFAEERIKAKDPTGYHAAQVGLSGVDMFAEALGKWR